MPNAAQAGAVIFAKDLHRVATFYEKLLGWKMVECEGPRQPADVEGAASRDDSERDARRKRKRVLHPCARAPAPPP